ncbi:MAG: ABC transporter permease subunit [Bacteroidales bacterium]|nr:ABC transporter permease subunit [Bacteroidales bacterium]
MRKLRHIVIFTFLFAVIIAIYYFFILSASQGNISLSSPELRHWFGTDINGTDVFMKSVEAFGFEILTLLIVLIIIWFAGILFGSVTYVINWKTLQDFFLNFIHYMATLPILLIALFLMIIFGAGFINSVLILSISIIPTQALFVYNQLQSAKNEEFLIAKRSYGMSNTAILRFHLLPFIVKKYNNYTFARIPEIIMMNLALNFLGLGIQEPYSSLGRMLFDGLSFMFSAWWLWVIPTLLVILIFSFVFQIKRIIYFKYENY